MEALEVAQTSLPVAGLHATPGGASLGRRTAAAGVVLAAGGAAWATPGITTVGRANGTAETIDALARAAVAVSIAWATLNTALACLENRITDETRAALAVARAGEATAWNTAHAGGGVGTVFTDTRAAVAVVYAYAVTVWNTAHALGGILITETRAAAVVHNASAGLSIRKTVGDALPALAVLTRGTTNTGARTGVALEALAAIAGSGQTG